MQSAHAVRLTPVEFQAPIVPMGSHVVQFYENEAFLAATVAAYAAEGLRAGQIAVVIATEAHRRAMLGKLDVLGVDSRRARRNGQLLLLDARETLSSFMRDGMPDAELFRAAIGSIFESRRQATRKPAFRFYGEMVDVLWRDGMSDAALALEGLWNDLAKSRQFALLCAYPLGNFPSSSDSERFLQVCQAHSHAVPTERYMAADEEARLREIALLQQRAQALQSELEYRRHLEQRLREALEQAAAANRAKSDFLAVMSHELRTPLNAIGGHVQLLEMGIHGPVSGDQMSALARVQVSQRHLLSLINDMLNLTRLESGRVEFLIAPLDVLPLLDEARSLLQPLWAEKRLACTISANAPASRVEADADRLQQIIFNLLTNAIKFTPPGGEIELGVTSGAGDQVAITVRDTGVGIEPAKIEAIFEPFVQLGGRPWSRQEGVGLGLAIGRQLARGMGGDLRAESTPGTGSTFILTMPAA